MHPAFTSGDLKRLTPLHIRDCACGREHRITTQEIALGSGNLAAALPELVSRHFPAAGAVLLVADKHTWAAAGDAVADVLQQAHRKTVREMLKPASADATHAQADELHADDASIDRLTTWLGNNAAPKNIVGVIAIGAGTINDIAKAACTRQKLPLITIPTAASMNGYTSAIAAILSNGVKTTQPCNPPTAILADANIVATAPHPMTAAGFGDLLSKNASGADWMLGHILHGDYYCAGPARVVDQAIQNAIARRKAIRANAPDGVQALTEALLLSGISMALAGSSSPASGGEHLISHLWDMTAHWTGRAPALHGAQTGVTTLISLALYEKILAVPAQDLIRLPLDPAFATPAALKKGMAAQFRDLAAAVTPIAAKKFQTKEDMARRRKLIFDHWEEIVDELRAITVTPQQSRQWLREAGAPVTARSLGISAEEVRFAYRYSRWIRDRYTVLDLAADLGMLDIWMDEVLAASGVLG